MLDVPETMRAAVYHGRRDLRIEEVPTPQPRQDELLLRVRAAGVCGTDAAEWERGPNVYTPGARHPVTDHQGPLIPGHELTGEVVARGEQVDGFPAGTLVACGAGFTVGEDRLTRSGKPHLSPLYATVGLQANGGFAEYCVVPARACMPVEGLPPDAAALAQPLAIGVHALRRGRLQDGEGVLVIGVGGIGAFVVAAAVQQGARVTAVDLDEGRLASAEGLGAWRTVVASSASAVDDLDDEEVLPDLIVEATGSADGFALAARTAKAGCRIVIVGLQAAAHEIDLRLISQREHELIGSNAQDGAVDLPEAVRLLSARSEGWDDIAPLAIPLDEIVDRGILPLVERRAPNVKTLVDPWTDKNRTTHTVSRGG